MNEAVLAVPAGNCLSAFFLLGGSPVRFATGWWQRSLLPDAHAFGVYLANVSSDAVGFTQKRVYPGLVSWAHVLGIIHRQAWRIMQLCCALMALLVTVRWFWCRQRGGYYLFCAVVLLVAAGHRRWIIQG